jgi:hypothetical protein
MLAMTTPRMAEQSRPDYARDLRDFARLEFPHEDLHTLTLLARATPNEGEIVPRRWSRWFRSPFKSRKVVSAKA